MQLRLAEEKDLPALYTMYRELVARMRRDGMHIWDDVYPCIALDADVHARRMYVLTDGGTVVSAFALCDGDEGESAVAWRIPGRALYMGRLGVNVRYARQGIGARMMDAGLRLAAARGADSVRFFVAVENAPAVALYRRKGYTQAEGVNVLAFDDGFTLYEWGFEKRTGRGMEMEIIRLREHPELSARAAKWFHGKWGVPEEAYAESIADCQRAGAGAVPQWYLAMDGDTIAGGLGVIENDFHDRPDLTPNVCAVYVEEEYRCRGFAGELLRHVCRDMAGFGVRTLYLLTDHTGFYERYGWEYFCAATGDGESVPSRMYRHIERED